MALLRFRVFPDALSGGELFFLDMGSETSANSTALIWVDVGKPSFDTTNYQPVMALAQNHIHFLDVTGLQSGQADILVIHCERITTMEREEA